MIRATLAVLALIQLALVIRECSSGYRPRIGVLIDKFVIIACLVLLDGYPAACRLLS